MDERIATVAGAPFHSSGNDGLSNSTTNHLAPTGSLIVLNGGGQDTPGTVAMYGQGHCLPDALQSNVVADLSSAVDLDAVKGNHNIAALQARALGRRSR